MSQAFSAAQLDPLFTAVPTLEYGALGTEHQWRHLATAMQAAGHSPELQDLTGRFAVEMAVWAIQDAPLDARLLRLVCDLDGHSGCAQGLPLQAWLDRSAVPDLRAPEYAAWHIAETPEEIRAALSGMAQSPASALFWLQAGFNRALGLGHFELARDLLAQIPADLPGRAPLFDRLHAEWALHALPPTEALTAVQQVRHAGFSLWHTRMTADLLRTLGDHETATSLYADLWRAIGFHPNLTLHLYELLHPGTPATVPDNASAPAIVLYSWNKASLLQQTLHTLRASDIGGAPVFVLDNGSNDDTHTMLAAMRTEWGDRPFTHISLPVNVGAPAARNWLLSLPEVQARPWAAFLDDDIILPPDWLSRLWGTAQAHPDAGTVGCTITDHTPPYRIQCADFFLLPPEQGQRSFVDLQEHTFVYANAAGLTDSALTDFSRPCLHVSGCCHLVNMQSVAACGSFDIRFTPSQFDDLERDMRAGQAGFHAVYNGGLRIRHMQHSSLRQANTPAKNGHIFGNKIKLEHIHGAQAIDRLRVATNTLARNDMKHKTTRLHAMLGA